MFPGKKLLIVVLYLSIFAISVSPARAQKSVYVINDTLESELQAYKINDNNLIYQTDYSCVTETEPGNGAVAIAVDESEYGQFLFVTFERENVIELVDAKKMVYVDAVIAPGATNLAGIAVDKGKSKLYAVDRYTNHLYSWSWNPATKLLTPDFIAPYYVQLEDTEDAFGIGLDENSGRLYVADNTDAIKYYDIADWSKVGEVNNLSSNVISIAIDVNNQLLYYGSMGSYGEGDPNLYQYDISASTENFVSVGCSVAGIAVDQQTSLIYLTTYGGSGDVHYPYPPGDRLFVYDANLDEKWYSSDIGNPAGVAVGTAATYKPPSFYLKKVDVNEPNCVAPGDYITYEITYGPNGVDHNNIVITDFLSSDVQFVPTVDPNAGTYHLDTHTVAWNLDNLDADDPCGSVTLMVQVNECILECGTITNYCEIESDSSYRTAETNTPICSASGPDPSYGEIVELRAGELNLSWCPGFYAAAANGHQVYLGADYEDVRDANTSDPNIYKGTVPDPSYQHPFNEFALDTTYYWRVDEVNGTNLWKGSVWSFTTSDYLVVDDFEAYHSGDPVYQTWCQWQCNETSSEVYRAENPALDTQSMEYRFMNYTYPPHYSEAWAELGDLGVDTDFISMNVQSISIQFYGQAANPVTEQMYAILSDGTNTATVDYTGLMTNIQEEKWHEWNVAIPDFTADNCDVDLSDVEYIGIGFAEGAPADGTVYFDDIWLSRRCFSPESDFEHDCDVDFLDYTVLASAWLTDAPDISLDDDNDVDIYDLGLFCEDWLWQEDGEMSMMSFGGGDGFYTAAPPEQPQPQELSEEQYLEETKKTIEIVESLHSQILDDEQMKQEYEEAWQDTLDILDDWLKELEDQL